MYSVGVLADRNHASISMTDYGRSQTQILQANFVIPVFFYSYRLILFLMLLAEISSTKNKAFRRFYKSIHLC